MISVIIPVYNAGVEKFKHCLDSLLNQTYSNFELILVDDGSSDGSGEICDEYGVRFVCCNVIHQTNKGVSEARNAGLAVAEGDWIAFVDADDYLHPRYLEVLYNIATASHCDIALVDFARVDENSPVLPECIESGYEIQVLSQEKLMEGVFDLVDFIVVWGKLYRRNLLKSVWFTPSLYVAEDLEFNSRVYQIAQKTVAINATLYYWVKKSPSAADGQFSRPCIDILDAYCLALDNIPKNNSRDRAFALSRIYKVILHTRYNVTLEYKQEFREKAKLILDATWGEFGFNGHISPALRCAFLIFYFIPATYTFFRWILNKRANRKTVKK